MRLQALFDLTAPAWNMVRFCEAVVGLIVNPVNSVVPAMCELWKKKGRLLNLG